MPRKQVKGCSVGVLMPVGLMRQPSGSLAVRQDQ